jgi:hypothetical protein
MIPEDIEVEECEDAYENPKCPYVTVINRTNESIAQTKTEVSVVCSNVTDLQSDMVLIKKALLGDDLQGGMISRVSQLWLAHKAELFLMSVVITALVAHAFNLV